MADRQWIDQAQGVYVENGVIYGPPGKTVSVPGFGDHMTFDASGKNVPQGAPVAGSPYNTPVGRAPAGQIPSVGAGAPRGGPQSAYSGISINSGAQSMPDEGLGGQQGWGGRVASVGKWLGRNAGWLSPLALGAWSAYEGHRSDKRSQALEAQALAMSEERYKAMLAGLDDAKNIQRPDLSYLSDDPGNPYARRRIPSVGGRAA